MKRTGYYRFFLLSILLTVGLFPLTAHALFSFGKKPYLAKVGDEVITVEEFVDAINRLHKSNKVGEALSKRTSFERPDFALFLEDLIDEKLMVVEALRLGLDREEWYRERLKTYIINLSLTRLRKEEVLDKVKVEDGEIERYYREELKKEGEIPEGERKRIRKILMDRKIKAREREFFKELRERADIRIDKEALKRLSEKDKDMVVAHVNGKPVKGEEVVRMIKEKKLQMDDKTKRDILDKIILYRLLDEEALKRGYTEEKEIKRKIKAYRERLLKRLFKAGVVAPLVKVEEKEIMEYYDRNRERFRRPDMVNLRAIPVSTREEAEAIMEELKEGADFSYLARTRSINTALREKGGEMGWVPINTLSPEIVRAVEDAKEGDIIGPFRSGHDYIVVEFMGLKKGGYRPLKEVRGEIDRTIGRKKFKKVLKDYLTRLRKVVPIKINKRELKRLEEAYGGNGS